MFKKLLFPAISCSILLLVVATTPQPTSGSHCNHLYCPPASDTCKKMAEHHCIESEGCASDRCGY